MKKIIDNTEIIKQINLNDPIHIIDQKEFDLSLLKFGSLVSIKKNKKINQTMLLQLILEDESYREIFKGISEIESDYNLIKNLVIRFPILCKSKIIKNKIKEILNDGNRKTVL